MRRGTFHSKLIRHFRAYEAAYEHNSTPLHRDRDTHRQQKQTNTYLEVNIKEKHTGTQFKKVHREKK